MVGMGNGNKKKLKPKALIWLLDSKFDKKRRKEGIATFCFLVTHEAI